MKQSILFEKGKLYVVELPEKANLKFRHSCGIGGFDSCRCLNTAYNQAYLAAFVNKVEVKNPEEIIRKGELFPDKWFLKQPLTVDDYLKILKDGDTFPLPADLYFDKETGMLKRIDPEKLIDEFTSSSLHDRIGRRMEALLKKQKSEGKQFITDQQVDDLIDEIMQDEIENKKPK